MPIHLSRASSEPDRDATAILDDLRRIVRVLRESSRAAESQLGVSGAQLFVLRALAGSPALSLNELAARTRTHQSSVSVVVKRLVAHGLVARAPSHHDARRLELTLTRRGALMLERAPGVAQDRIIEGIENMPAKQRTLLARGLHALVESIGRAHEAPEMFFEEASATTKTPPTEPQRRKRSASPRTSQHSSGRRPARRAFAPADAGRRTHSASTVARR